MCKRQIWSSSAHANKEIRSLPPAPPPRWAEGGEGGSNKKQVVVCLPEVLGLGIRFDPITVRLNIVEFLFYLNVCG